MENNIKKETIEIQSHQPKNLGSWIKIDIVDSENRKFQFGTKKKDGGETKAFTFYKSVKSAWDNLTMMGKSIKVVVDYNEIPKSFTDPKTGKVVNYTQRTIIGFSEPKEDSFKSVPEYDNPAFDNIPVIEDDEPYDNEEIPF
jgi:hypothetical protein